MSADERTLAFLHELERADEAAAAVLAELDELAAEVERVREAAADAGARLERLPGERAASAAAREEAEALAAERRVAQREAEARLAAAEERGDEARIAAARRDEVRARDLLRSAERQLERALVEEERLKGEEGGLRWTTEELAGRVQALAEDLARRPGLGAAPVPPREANPAGLAAWATETRAALFVARGRLASEREAVLRQANELGTLILGEPLAAQSASLVARRVAERRTG